MINAKLQNIIDTKSAIGNAINNKGGSITSETPFYEYAPAIENISSGGGAYSTWVLQDENSAKYTVFNGYDALRNTNPNLSTIPYNKYLLNNGATGDIVLENVITAQTSEFSLIINNSVGINNSNMLLLGNTVSNGSVVRTVGANNGFLYVGEAGKTFKKFNATTLQFVGETNINNPIWQTMAFNNGFVYAGGWDPYVLYKISESNMAVIANTNTSFSGINSVKINNGFIYLSRGGGYGLEKYNEGNLTYISSLNNSAQYATTAFNSVAINNGFIYTGYLNMVKFRESNFTYVSQTNFPVVFDINNIAINNGFIYVVGGTNNVYKYNESSFAFSSNASINGIARGIAVNNGFVYVGTSFGTSANTVEKYHESNLTFLTKSSPYLGSIWQITTSNNFLYISGDAVSNGGRGVSQYTERTDNLVALPIYNITTVKE